MSGVGAVDGWGATDTVYRDLKMTGGKRRAGRGEGLYDHKDNLCMFRNVEPDDLREEGSGNVWLVAAVSALW